MLSFRYLNRVVYSDSHAYRDRLVDASREGLLSTRDIDDVTQAKINMGNNGQAPQYHPSEPQTHKTVGPPVVLHSAD